MSECPLKVGDRVIDPRGLPAKVMIIRPKEFISGHPNGVIIAYDQPERGTLWNNIRGAALFDIVHLTPEAAYLPYDMD